MPQERSDRVAALHRLFPDVDADIFARLQNDSNHVKLPKGYTVFSPGDACSSFLVVLLGSVKVVQYSASGREIVLYRIGPGESCLLTTSCLIANTDYTVSAITESDAEAIALPARAFHAAMDASAAMRQFVFRNYSRRMADFITLIRELAFDTLDRRLSQRLLEQADARDVLHTTHQALAAELGSTREVVSRRLKEFEQAGWIRLRRGKIELNDKLALARNLGRAGDA